MKKKSKKFLKPLQSVGWREWLALPELGIDAIRAKLDTGARSSSLHVENFDVFEQDGKKWVRFELHRADGVLVAREAEVIDQREVTDSGGNMQIRPFIKSSMRLAGVLFDAEINLTNRQRMLFPLLVGRTALAGRFSIDSGQSFVLGDWASPNEIIR